MTLVGSCQSPKGTGLDGGDHHGRDGGVCAAGCGGGTSCVQCTNQIRSRPKILYDSLGYTIRTPSLTPTVLLVGTAPWFGPTGYVWWVL